VTDELRRSMTDTTSKEAILRLAKAISDDLYVAIANSEVFVPSGRDPALIERVNDQQVHAGFNVNFRSPAIDCDLDAMSHLGQEEWHGLDFGDRQEASQTPRTCERSRCTEGLAARR
jgi:hypothetical protein